MAKKTLGLKQTLRDADGEQRKVIADGLPYEVGFGKPPKHTRFAPGNTQGKRGRPKGSENLSTIIKEELDARIAVTEGGKTRKESKRRILFRQLTNKAVNGDLKAIGQVLEAERKFAADGTHTAPPVFDSRDAAAFARLADLLASNTPTADEDDGATS